MKSLISTIAAFTLVVSSLCGCASNYGEPITPVNYYPACYAPIQDLRARENDVGKGTIGGAFVGALGGALLGLMGGGGRWQGAVVGGTTGAIAGTMIGNSYAMREKYAEDNRHMAAYMQHLDGDISNLDIAGAAARTSLQCYDRQFEALLTQIRARTVSRDVAARRFAEISAGREEAIAILGQTAEYGRNLYQQYEEALNAAEKPVAAKKSKTQKAAQSGATGSGAARKRAIQKKTQGIDAEIASAKAATARQNQEMNAEISKIYENAIDARI